MSLSLFDISYISKTNSGEEFLGFWYVSESEGSDDNSGYSETSPLRNISTLLSKPELDNNQTIFIQDGTFREFLNLGAYDGMTVVGATTKPKITAFDVAPNAGFTLTSGRVNTYQASWTPDYGTNDINSLLSVHEGGVPLRYRATIDLCEANPGSYHVPGFANGGVATTVYIHPYGSTNPTSDGKTYEITKRLNAIVIGDSAIIQDLHCVGNIDDNGIIIAKKNVLIERCLIEHGNNHNVFAESGIIRDSTIRYNDESQLTAPTLVVFFSASTQSPKISGLVENTSFIGGHPNDTNFSKTQAVYAHDGIGTNSYATITARNCTSDKCTVMASAAADEVIHENCNVLKARTIGASATSANHTYRGGFYTYSTNMSPSSNKFNRAYGARFFDRTGTIMLNLVGSNQETTFENCSFGHVSGAAGSTSRILAINTGARNPVIRFNRCVIQQAGLTYLFFESLATHIATLNSANNIFWRSVDVVAVIVTGNLSLAQWKTNSATDAGSVRVDPMYVDAPNGNFTTQGAGATTAASLQAGVEYYAP